MTYTITEEQAISLACSVGTSFLLDDDEEVRTISQYFENLSYPTQKCVLAINPYQIRFLANPSTELQLIAIRKHVNSFASFSHMKNIQPEVICEAILLSLNGFYTINFNTAIEENDARGMPDFIHNLLWRAKCDDSIQELLVKSGKWEKIPSNTWSNNIRKKYKYMFSMRAANIL